MNLRAGLALTVLVSMPLITTGNAAGMPSGPTIFRQSMAAITHSLRSVHGEETTISHQHGEVARSRISSDCTMTTSSFVGQFWLRGTRFAGPEPVNTHYVAAWSYSSRPGSSRTWVRSPRTNYRWQRADSDNTALEFLVLCPTMMVKQMQQAGVMALAAPGSFVNRGAVTLRGYRTWHLRSESSHNKRTSRVDVFVDQRTHVWIRLVQDSRQTISSSRTVLDYSRFNAPVRILLPRT